VATGSDRLAYAGMQMAMAFFLCVLVGTGPHTDLAVARDRVVGILLGNVIVWLVFSNLWPVSIARQARQSLAEAFGRLAQALRPAQADDQALLALDDALARAHRSYSFHLFEPRRMRSDEAFAEGADLAQALFRPAVVLGPDDDPPAALSYRATLADWLSRTAAWIAEEAGDPPSPPLFPALANVSAGRTAWYGELARRAETLSDAMRRWDGNQKDARP
jgi:multidrug resistance protein MdtO